jgi:hypothetical protein
MRRIGMFGLAIAFVAGCGEDQTATQQERATRELQQAERQLREERQRLERESRQADGASSGGSSSQDAGGSGGERGRIPNVKGKDHQLAQDTMQAAGFYNLSEEDASGQDRPLIYDRNWTVVSQSPKPGTKTSLDRTIILRAKKDGE